MWEGGYREPCVMRWPGKIPAGTKCDELASHDRYVSHRRQTHRRRDANRSQDRRQRHLAADVRRDGAKSPHEVLCCYYDRRTARRCAIAQWKLVFPHQYRSLDGKPGGRDGNPVPYKQLKTKEALYDLKNDVGETTRCLRRSPRRRRDDSKPKAKKPAPRSATNLPTAKAAKCGHRASCSKNEFALNFSP